MRKRKQNLFGEMFKSMWAGIPLFFKLSIIGWWLLTGIILLAIVAGLIKYLIS